MTYFLYYTQKMHFCCEYQMVFIICDTNSTTSELPLLRKICENFWHILKTWEGDGREDHGGGTCKQTSEDTDKVYIAEWMLPIHLMQTIHKNINTHKYACTYL